MIKEFDLDDDELMQKHKVDVDDFLEVYSKIRSYDIASAKAKLIKYSAMYVHFHYTILQLYEDGVKIIDGWTQEPFETEKDIYEALTGMG